MDSFMLPMFRRSEFRRPGNQANRPSPLRITQMRRAIRARHPTNPQRQRAASRALANTRSDRLTRGVNRAMWNVRRRLTPTTMAAALGGALAAMPTALLGTLLTQVGKEDK